MAGGWSKSSGGEMTARTKEKVMLKTAIVVIFLLAAIVIVCNSCDGIKISAKAERTDTLSATIGEGWVLVASGVNGGITVDGADTSECLVEATITGRSDTDENALALIENVTVTLDVDEDGKTLTLALPEDMPSRVSVGYVIRVPRKTTLTLDTSNAKVSVAEIEGGVRVHTSNSSVSCSDITGDLDVATSNGEIHCENISGGFVGRTSNSRVSMEYADGGGDFKVKTSNGSVTCVGARGGVDVVTSNASVSVEYSKDGPADATVDVKTSNASIALTLPVAFAGEVRANTSNGAVRSARSFAATRQSGSDLDATIGSGGSGTVRLDTSNASIDID